MSCQAPEAHGVRVRIHCALLDALEKHRGPPAAPCDVDPTAADTPIGCDDEMDSVGEEWQTVANNKKRGYK